MEKKTFRKEFKINNHITLKLRGDKTEIYIKNNLFSQCKHLLLFLPQNNEKLYKIDSIDDLEYMKTSIPLKNLNITPEEEFWGHCSNIQMWAENNYDSKILHRNLAFPLLKELWKVGDIKAKKYFKEEIAKRIDGCNYNTLFYLIKENYLDYFSREELIMLGLKDFIVLRKLKKILEEEPCILDEIDLSEPLSFKVKKKRIIGIGISNSKRDLRTIPNFLKELSELKEIYINECNLIEIPDFIGEYTKLQTLYLRDNMLTKIPHALSDLKNLKILNLSNNKIKKIPDFIKKTNYLEELNLENNPINQ